MSGGSMQPTQTTVSGGQPWNAAQPALKTSLDAAQNLYAKGIGPQVYTGSTVIPYSQPTQSGMNQMQSAATGWWPAFQDNFGRTTEIAAQGGLNDLQRSSVAQLQPMASGEMLVKNKPFTDAVVNRQADLIQNRIAEQAGSMGRYGSGAHQTLLTRDLGDLANQAYSQDYNRERQYMQDAIGSIFNAGQQQYSNQLNNTNALSNAYNAAMLPSQTLRNVGSMYEDLATRQKNDELRIFNEAQNTPWEQVARLNAIASGAGSLGSSNTQTTYAQGPSGLQQGIGGLTTGLGLLGALGGMF